MKFRAKAVIVSAQTTSAQRNCVGCILLLGFTPQSKSGAAKKPAQRCLLGVHGDCAHRVSDCDSDSKHFGRDRRSVEHFGDQSAAGGSGGGVRIVGDGTEQVRFGVR